MVLEQYKSLEERIEMQQNELEGDQLAHAQTIKKIREEHREEITSIQGQTAGQTFTVGHSIN